MSDAKRKWGKLLMHALIVPTLCLSVYLLSHATGPWSGIDEAVVEKIAKEHGREAKAPLFDPSSDVLLFAFLLAGACGGFAAGYYWRELVRKKDS